MKPIWLVGERIAHSLSPAMHNAALVAMGLAPVYALRPTHGDEIGRVLDDAEQTCGGINLTAPFKIAAAERYRGALDEDARLAGAVNTMVFRDGHVARALNTDVEGLLRAWRRTAAPVEGRTMAIVGAGGAARAAVVAAKKAGVRALVVHARNSDAAASLVALATTLDLEAIAATEPCGAAMCVVAATEVDDPEALIARTLPGAGFIHDLRYGTSTHPLRAAALSRRHLYSDGTTLLFFQGVQALEAFLGAALPDVAVDAMRRALVAG